MEFDVRGWAYADFMKIAHQDFEKRKGHLRAFNLMLAAHGRGQQIFSEDTT